MDDGSNDVVDGVLPGVDAGLGHGAKRERADKLPAAAAATGLNRKKEGDAGDEDEHVETLVRDGHQLIQDRKSGLPAATVPPPSPAQCRVPPHGSTTSSTSAAAAAQAQADEALRQRTAATAAQAPTARPVPPPLPGPSITNPTSTATELSQQILAALNALCASKGDTWKWAGKTNPAGKTISGTITIGNEPKTATKINITPGKVELVPSKSTTMSSTERLTAMVEAAAKVLPQNSTITITADTEAEYKQIAALAKTKGFKLENLKTADGQTFCENAGQIELKPAQAISMRAELLSSSPLATVQHQAAARAAAVARQAGSSATTTAASTAASTAANGGDRGASTITELPDGSDSSASSSSFHR